MRTAFCITMLLLLAGCTSQSDDDLARADETTDTPKAADEQDESDAIVSPEEGMFNVTRYFVVKGDPGCDAVRLESEAPRGEVDMCGGRYVAPYTVDATGNRMRYPAGSEMDLTIWGTTDVPNPTTIRIQVLLNQTAVVDETWEYLSEGGGGVQVAGRDSFDQFTKTISLDRAAEGNLRVTLERTQGESFWLASGGEFVSSLKVRAT